MTEDVLRSFFQLLAPNLSGDNTEFNYSDFAPRSDRIKVLEDASLQECTELHSCKRVTHQCG